jgi:hypothetical protein
LKQARIAVILDVDPAMVRCGLGWARIKHLRGGCETSLRIWAWGCDGWDFGYWESDEMGILMDERL